MLRRLLRELGRGRRASVQDLIARAQAERARGEFAAALASLRAALEQDAANAAALIELGLTYRTLDRHDDARVAFERALASDPFSVPAHMFLGNVAHEAGRLDVAVRRYQAALAIDGQNAALHYNLALTLMQRGEADAAVAAFRRCLAEAPDYPDARSSLLFAQNVCAGVTPEETASEHFEWARRYADSLGREREFPNLPDAERRLRIGYVSADFFGHAAADFVHSFLPHHDRRDYQILCYCNAALREPACDLYGHTWRDVSALDDARLASLIEQDAIDVLVDLSGHTRGNRLLALARKPAPLQMTFLGYPNTTGMRAMDYRLTDAYADPPGTCEGRYRERLLRMPHSLWCYCPRTDVVAEAGALPALRNGYITFGSMNGVYKLNQNLLGLWADLLLRSKDARLLLATIPPGSVRDRIARVFTERGVDAARIEFVERLSKSEFRALHQRIDIALDSYPCNGGATTCDALWLGVPVVSLAGDEFRARAGLSMLSAVGLPQLAARSAADFVTVAADLAQDLGRLQRLRAGLRQTMRDSPLCDALAYTRALEDLYRAIWREWCANHSAAARISRSSV